MNVTRRIRRLRFILPALLLFSPGLTAQSLLPIVENYRYGFIDPQGNIIIPPKFPSVGLFSEGLAPARLEGLYGYIDTSGAWEIEPRFDYAESFRNGLAHVFVDGKPFVIDRRGTVLFDHNFVEIGKFVDGHAVVTTSSNRCGMVDRNGRLTVDTAYIFVGPYSNGVALIRDSTYSTGVIDMQRKMIVPFGTYDWIYPFSNGRARIRFPYEEDGPFGRRGWNVWPIGDKGFITTRGEVIGRFSDYHISLHPDTSDDFNGGFAVIRNDHYPIGLIDTTGRIVFYAPEVIHLLPFHTDCSFGITADYTYIMIDNEGHSYNSIPYQRIATNSFVEEFACVRTEEGWIVIDRAGKRRAGPLDIKADNAVINGQVVLFEPNFSDAETRWSLWNFVTDTVIKFSYGFLRFTSSVPSVLFARQGDHYAYLDLNGKLLWSQGPSDSLPGLNIDFVATPECWSCRQESGRPLTNGEEFAPISDRLSVVARRNDTVQFNNGYNNTYKGMELYVVNPTADTLLLDIDEGELRLELQAKDRKGTWHTIVERVPLCWSEYTELDHPLYLPAKSYWTYLMPVFEGGFRTRLRAALTYTPADTIHINPYGLWEGFTMRPPGGPKIIYSNEFEGTVNPAQFWRKDHQSMPMDPYYN